MIIGSLRQVRSIHGLHYHYRSASFSKNFYSSGIGRCIHKYHEKPLIRIEYPFAFAQSWKMGNAKSWKGNVTDMVTMNLGFNS